MKKYIVALDLDETLLNSERELSLRNQKTLQLCKNAGMKLAISSARGFGSCKKFANEINADYVCCQAGNMIVNYNGKIIYKNAFEKTVIKEIIERFSKYTDCFVVDSDFDLYGTKDSKIIYFDELPEVAKEYAKMSAAYKFVKRELGSQAVCQYTQEDFSEARIALEQHELEIGNYTMIPDMYNGNIRSSI